MKAILTYVVLLAVQIGHCQTTDQDNLEKYWKYRDQLRKRFMKVGINPGESIPSSVIIPNRQYGQTDQATGSIIQWRDATITLGYYWIVLATEYKLLSENNQDVQPTLNELYYSMYAFNRLDMTAEGYLSGNLQAPASPSDQNGFFIRDDVHHSITQNFANDPPISNGPIQPDPGHPNQMRGDFEGWHNVDDGIPNNEIHTTEPHLAGSESLDQLTTILLGLYFIQRFCPNEFVQPTPEDAGFYVRDEALDMIQRIVEYLNDTEENWAGQYSAKEWTLLQGDDETVHNGGYNCILASYPITEMMKELFDSAESEMIGEPGEVRWQFRTGDICIDVGNGNGQSFDDSAFLQRIVNALTFSPANYTLGLLITASPEIANIAALQGAVWASSNCSTDFCCEAVDGPLIIEVPNETIRKIWERIEDWNLPINANGSGSISVFTGDLSIKIDGIAHDLPVLTPIPIVDKMIDDDNVHIMHELAILGNIWSPAYISFNAYQSNMVHLPMMHDILHEGGNRVATSYNKGYYSSLLEQAPCFGPWADPYTLTNVPNEWASANRLFHPGDRILGAKSEANGPDPEYRGYFPGIDYMVIYNLYHLLWQTELPDYTRNSSCNCVSEITADEELSSLLEVNRKFPDYKAKGIPIESFLAHDLTVTSSTGVLNVRNDLIICRELPEVQTTLRIENGATVNLYEENTITVREGNRIVLTEGGQLLAGLDNDDGSYLAATIVLEENAELIVEDDAAIICYGGLNLVMKPGSQFTLYGGDCITAGEGFDGIFFDTDGAIISLTNATVISHDHFGHPNSTINNTDINCIHAEMRFTRSETSLFETHLDESNYYLDDSSSLFVSSPVTLSHGELDVSTTSKLYIHYGNLTIGENALLDWHSNTSEITGGNSSLAFDHGQIHIPANHEFTFEYGGQQSGFIDIKQGSTNVIINDNNSIFRIHGFGKEDLCLRISDATLKNINPQLGKFYLSNCLIEMEGSGNIVTDMFFDASNCKFMNGKLALWHSPVNIYASDFQHSYINSKFQKIIIKHSDFIDGGIEADGSTYVIEHTSFDSSYVESMNLSSVSFIKQCDFTNDEFIFVADESLVEIRVSECEFTSDGHFHSDNSPYGIFKVGGILTLKCNKFKDLNEAIHGANGCIISMTENDNSGNNQFTQCNHMIVCDDALDLKINDGYNDFSDLVTSVFTGNLDGYTCDNNGPNGECTHPELEANNNIWLHSSPPEEPDHDFHGTVTSNCDGPAEWEDCIITIVDHSPIEEFICRDKTPIGKIEKSTTYTNGTGNSETFKYVPEVNPNQSNMNKDFEVGNPNITTSSFENTPLEEALLFAANTSELIDSLGNDSLCIDLFHQIIMSDIDLQDEEIRWKLLWGQRHMKSAVENRFTQGEITQLENEIAFHSDVQKYVDVLNTLTYQLVPDSEYTQQYYLELDKGQLFNTLGNYQMANQLFTNLDDCEIDSLEQQILNGWIIQTQMAMDETTQYLAGVSIDSIQGTADTSSLLTPFVLLADTYFFGAIIHSPQFVEFAPCDLNNRNLRLPKSEDQTIKVYPNPSQGSFTVQNLGKQLIHSIELMDRSGRCIFKSGTITSDQQTLQINLTPTIASGLYILRINIGETYTYKTIAIQ